jgi:hypothetical protein
MTSSNMTCEAFDAALPDFLEGTLGEDQRAAVEGHLSECVRCASLLRDLENIRRDAAALPDLVPSRDLWSGIEARIAAPVIPLAARPSPRRRVAPLWMGIAAAALIVSTAGITYLLTARSLRPTSEGVVALVNGPGAQTDSNAAPDNGPVSPAAVETPKSGPAAAATAASSRLATGQGQDREPAPAARFASGAGDQARSDAVYGREIEMLQKIVSQRKTQLDSSTVAIIEKNLSIIDAAIAQSRAALARDPASRLLTQQLSHALDKKVELLRTAAMLPAST